MVIGRPIIRIGYQRWFEELHHEDWNTSDEEDRKSNLDAASVQIVGPLLVLAGTLLSGYGDLVGQELLSALK